MKKNAKWYFKSTRGWKGPFRTSQMLIWYECRAFPLCRGIDFEDVYVRKHIEGTPRRIGDMGSAPFGTRVSARNELSIATHLSNETNHSNRKPSSPGKNLLQKAFSGGLGPRESRHKLVEDMTRFFRPHCSPPSSPRDLPSPPSRPSPALPPPRRKIPTVKKDGVEKSRLARFFAGGSSSKLGDEATSRPFRKPSLLKRANGEKRTVGMRGLTPMYKSPSGEHVLRARAL